MIIYDAWRWETRLTPGERQRRLIWANKTGRQLWRAPDGSYALADVREIDEYAAETGDDDWTEVEKGD